MIWDFSLDVEFLILVRFMPPKAKGRSPLENSLFFSSLSMVIIGHVAIKCHPILNIVSNQAVIIDGFNAIFNT